jgi:hypothetical protein
VTEGTNQAGSAYFSTTIDIYEEMQLTEAYFSTTIDIY